MALIKWDPFREFNTLGERMGNLIGRNEEEPKSTATWNPGVDIFENEVIFKAELPGVERERYRHQR